jgi:hypothetical protein
VQALPSLQAEPSGLAGFEQPADGSQVPAVWHWSSAVHVTAAPPAQVPFWQVSFVVQTLPSLQAVPLGFDGDEQTPVAGLHVPAFWQAPGAGQARTVPEHVPPEQESSTVQEFPSSHPVPSAWLPYTQLPVVGLHVPGVWHGPGAGQITGLVPVHTPLWQVSLWVQRLPSLHTAPLTLVGALMHRPSAGSQLPARWHWSGAVQTTAEPPWQIPFWHESPVVHGLPSSHEVPFAFAWFEQVPVEGLQTPGAWHGSGVGHVTGLLPTQTPPRQASVSVQALPSLQAVPSGLLGRAGHAPVERSHVTAVWHGFGAVQVTAVPVQTPFWQASPVVHELPSSQAVPFALSVAEHAPVAGLHTGGLWHWSGAGPQSTVVWPTQVPPWQMSPPVQALPSLHDTPLRNVQTPFATAPNATEQASHTPPAQAVLQQ